MQLHLFATKQQESLANAALR